MAHPGLPVASSLEDLAGSGGITAVFHAGATALGHHWRLHARDGAPLARTVRVHRGGRLLQAFWWLWTVTGMHVGDNIHVELRGADDRVLARATSVNDKPAIVTVTDAAGQRVATSKRDKDTLTLYGPDDHTIAELVCDGDGPWPVRDDAGNAVGELLAGQPGPSTSPSFASWVVAPDLSLNSAAYAMGQHLGLRRVYQYAFSPARQSRDVALALLPLLAGLTY